MTTRLDIPAELLLKALACPDLGPEPPPAPKPTKAQNGRKGAE